MTFLLSPNGQTYFIIWENTRYYDGYRPRRVLRRKMFNLHLLQLSAAIVCEFRKKNDQLCIYICIYYVRTLNNPGGR